MITTVSYCLICYNQEKFILAAVKSALNQKAKNLEIIISDDCSTDNTFSIISKYIQTYNGEHKIILNRNETNYGLIKHLNKVITELASGEIIILASGDDVSFPIRTANTIKIFKKYHDVQAVTSQKCVINSNGGIQNVSANKDATSKRYNLKLAMAIPGFMVGGVALSFRKSLFSFFGPISNDCPTEDSTIRNRALLIGDIYESESTWSYYRIHENNMSLPSNIHRLKTKKIQNQLLNDVNIAYRRKSLNRIQKWCISVKINIWSKNNSLAIKSYSSKRNKRFILRFIILVNTVFYHVIYKSIIQQFF